MKKKNKIIENFLQPHETIWCTRALFILRDKIPNRTSTKANILIFIHRVCNGFFTSLVFVSLVVFSVEYVIYTIVQQVQPSKFCSKRYHELGSFLSDRISNTCAHTRMNVRIWMWLRACISGVCFFFNQQFCSFLLLFLCVIWRPIANIVEWIYSLLWHKTKRNTTRWEYDTSFFKTNWLQYIFVRSRSLHIPKRLSCPGIFKREMLLLSQIVIIFFNEGGVETEKNANNKMRERERDSKNASIAHIEQIMTEYNDIYMTFIRWDSQLHLYLNNYYSNTEKHRELTLLFVGRNFDVIKIQIISLFDRN